MESVTFSTHHNGDVEANGNGAGIDDSVDADIDEGIDDTVELHDVWRVWVTPSDRKRCTYVTRDEQPLAAVSANV